MEKSNEFYGRDPFLKERARFNEIKKSIEFGSNQINKSSLEISDFGLAELSLLEKGIGEITTDNHSGLIAVMRGWNLDSSIMGDITERVNKIKENIPALAGIFFVINGDGDVDDVTEKSLQKVIISGKNQLPIVPVKVFKYTWTSGLNSAVVITNEIAMNKKIDRDKIKIMNISYGVDLEKNELEKCRKSIEDERFIMTVRNTDKQELTIEKPDDGLLWEKFKELLRNPNNADLNYVLRSMRNTFNVLTLSDIVEYGGYNPATVSLGGMEDSDFFMRMILYALKSRDIKMIKEFKRALANPIAYSDQRWIELKHKKDPSETAALEKVLSGMAMDDNISDNEYRISENMQDFRMRKN
jgi:hypothetical protein